jgi:HEPN domain-containing protein
MPRDSRPDRTAAEWLRRARSNLARAKQDKPEDVLYEDLCFDAQQAVEKALKALLVSRGIAFRFVHDIGELMETISRGGIDVPEELRDAAELTGFAVEARYPGPFEAVSEDEWRRAVALAEAVFSWVEMTLQSGPRS